jgi:RNA polymerase sigma-70 factor (ECF subfamily)
VTPSSREARFRELYLSSYADVVRFAARRVEEREAEDVAADAFLVVWRRFEELPARPADARAWLFGIARGCLLNARRGRSRHEGLAVRLASVPAAGPEEGSLDDQVARRLDLAAAWQRLAPAEQEALALTLLDGLTSTEAAAVLGTTSTAYRLRLMRARATLRSLLDDPPAPGPTCARRPAVEATP